MMINPISLPFNTNSTFKLTAIIAAFALIATFGAATTAQSGTHFADVDQNGQFDLHLHAADDPAANGRTGVVHATSHGESTYDYATSWVQLDQTVALGDAASTTLAYDYYEGSNNANSAPDEVWLAINDSGTTHYVYQAWDSGLSGWNTRNVSAEVAGDVTHNGWSEQIDGGSNQALANDLAQEYGADAEILAVGFGKGAPQSGGTVSDVYYDNLEAGSTTYEFPTPTEGTVAKADTSGALPQGQYNYQTIQGAIDDPTTTSGDTVTVREGTYTETISVNKDVTLTGMNAADGNEAAVVDGNVKISAEGAKVSQLQVAPSTTFVSGGLDPHGILITASDVLVEENVVTGMTGNSTGGSVTLNGIQVWHDGPNNLTGIEIRDNTVSDMDNMGNPSAGWPNYGGAAAIKVQGVVSGVDVTGNTVKNVHSAGWAYGIVLTHTGNAPGVSPKNVEVAGNTVTEVNDGSKYAVSDDETAAPYPGSAFAIDGEADADEAEVHENAFTGTPIGAQNKDAEHVLAAPHNYWGAPTGPTRTTQSGVQVGDGAAVKGDVAWRPYYPTKKAMDAGNGVVNHADWLIQQNREAWSKDTDTTLQEDTVRKWASEEDTDTTLSEGTVKDWAQAVDTDTTLAPQTVRDLAREESHNETAIKQFARDAVSDMHIRQIARNADTSVSEKKIREIADQVDQDTRVSDRHIRRVVSEMTDDDGSDVSAEQLQEQQEKIAAQQERINELEQEIEQLKTAVEDDAGASDATPAEDQAEDRGDRPQTPSGFAFFRGLFN